MSYDEFIRANARWLGGGFLLTFASSFGQTFFISLFGGEIRAEFDLTHGGFGTIYSAATLTSAFILIWFGKTADSMRMVHLSALVLAGLALACLGMALVNSIIVLGLSIFLLRLMGQGMLTHIAMTAMGRWFSAHRGRAVGFVSLGHSVGDAILPFITIVLIGALGWRNVWFAAAGVLVLAVLPVIWKLFSVSRTPASNKPAAMARYEDAHAPKDWTRSEVLRDPVFYGLMPCTLGPPFITTGIFFHQVHLMDEKVWDIATIPAVFPFFAAAAVLSALGSGWIIDRWNASVLLPIVLLPLGLAVFLMGVIDATLVAGFFMVLTGMTTGTMNTISGAIWPELYGTKHIGAIRALMVSLMVFGTALAPGVVGALIDAGIGIETQMVFMAAYTVVASGFLWHVMRVILSAQNNEPNREQEDIL